MDKYLSRKFIITLLILTITVILAMISKMTGDISSVLTALAVAYPASQAAVDWKNK